MDSIADEAVVATNDYAAICKYQAVLKGYYEDPYIDKFLTAKTKTSMIKKSPEINHGYYVRSTAMAYIVEQFIKSNPHCQIISLGAGYDTLYWRLEDKNFIRQEDPSQKFSTKYVEIDMSPVVMHKISTIRKHQELNKRLTTVKFKGEGFHSDHYHLISFDLRQVDKTLLGKKLLEDCQMDPGKPTLCVSECVLVYMPVQDSSSLINWMSSYFSDMTFVNYEQCNMIDRFGEIMLANMNDRHCDLMGVDACKSIRSQMTRFETNGLPHTKGWTLLQVFERCLLPSARQRISKIEFLDEQELLEQLLEHYCIVIGSHKLIEWIPIDEYWLSVSTSVPGDIMVNDEEIA